MYPISGEILSSSLLIYFSPAEDLTTGWHFQQLVTSDGSDVGSNSMEAHDKEFIIVIQQIKEQKSHYGSVLPLKSLSIVVRPREEIISQTMQDPKGESEFPTIFLRVSVFLGPSCHRCRCLV